MRWFGDHAGSLCKQLIFGRLKKQHLSSASLGLVYRWKKGRGVFSRTGLRSWCQTVQIIGVLATILCWCSRTYCASKFWSQCAPLTAFVDRSSIDGFAVKMYCHFCSVLCCIFLDHLYWSFIYLPEKQLEGYVEEIGCFKHRSAMRRKRRFIFRITFFPTLPLVITHVWHIVALSSK